MQGKKTHLSPFRFWSNKRIQRLNTGFFGWGMILLAVALYYVFYFTQAKVGMTTEQLTPIGVCSTLPILLGAWLKARKGALLAWLLVQPEIILGLVLTYGTAWAAPTHIVLLLSLCGSTLGLALAAGHFRFISYRLSLVLQELRDSHEAIQKQALTDSLTGLPNHRAVMDQFQNELGRAKRYKRPFSVLFFDADHFKRVNDTHGHTTGDVVLCQIGERTSTVLRGGDTLGRFGGEEFVVLLPEADASEATIVAERIRSAVADGSMALSEVEGGIAMTVSIGQVTYPTDGILEHTLLSQADEAMYAAKRLGRNQVRTADEARLMSANMELMAILHQQEQREAMEREGSTPEQLRETSVLRTIGSLMALLERRDEGLSTYAYAVSALATAIAQWDSKRGAG